MTKAEESENPKCPGRMGKEIGLKKKGEKR
jgi:hypothetical protein